MLLLLVATMTYNQSLSGSGYSHTCRSQFILTESQAQKHTPHYIDVCVSARFSTGHLHIMYKLSFILQPLKFHTLNIALHLTGHMSLSCSYARNTIIFIKLVNAIEFTTTINWHDQYVHIYSYL